MKKIALGIFMILYFSSTINAQNSFNELWLKVERLEVDNLPKSALKFVDEIYAKATKEKNTPQIIKSLFYQSKFSLTLEEDAQLKVINNFKRHIKQSAFPTKNVLENVLANLYWQYYNNNRYKFYNRTKTTEKVDKTDFRTWDLNTFFEEIHLYYSASLNDNEQLQKIDVKDFATILQIEKEGKKYRPTLYDFLANNALEFYKTSENNITKPAYQFKIDTPTYLSDASTFTKLNLTSKDTLSLQFNALKVYQKLIQFHLKSNNLNAMAAIDLARISFVENHAVFTNKNDLHLQTLQTAYTTYKKHEACGLYGFEIARIYNNLANNYTSSKKEEHRFKNKKALALTTQVTANFPKSLGAQKCTILKNKILHKSLQITTEKYIPIQKNARLLVRYNNTNQLFFSAYKINAAQLQKFQNSYDFNTKKALLNTLQKVIDWNTSLRNEHDYIQHTTEVVVPKFNSGNYLIVASENEVLKENEIYATRHLQITNLALINNTFENKHTYQVVDRNNGKPIANATIQLRNKNNRYGAKINKKLTTDKNGFASFKSPDYYRNVVATVKSNDDAATFGNLYLQENRENKKNSIADKILLKPFIFTDRSIYRPGQKVYFKAIVIKKQGEKSTVLKNEYVSVILTDANNQEIKELDLKLNEFGSVAGEFTLPNNGLTGMFKIEVDETTEHDSEFYNKANFDYGNTVSFSVEEYKRPKFASKFKPVTETFKINDSIKVNGFAKAFSGANITDAKFVYRVYRKVQYPSWCYWRMPNLNTSAQEITHGVSSTNEKGEFAIVFKAMPDESVAKENLPVFTYEISADVTDVNGETRSATTAVKVGYHALLATISLNDKIDKTAKNNHLKITTENLNGEFIPAKGSLKIYKLEAPKKPQRPRVWGVPDYQDITETAFRKLFPNEPYNKEETDENKWKKGTLVVNEPFDTKKSKEISLKNSKKWISGKYIAVIESKDKFGQAVKDEKRFTVFSTKENTIPDSNLFFINTNKDFYQPNQNAVIQIGSASKDITVIVQIEKNHTIIQTSLIHLSNSVKTLKIPVTNEDIGGFAIKYHFVNYNYFKSGNLLINVPEQQEKIAIETNVFRDKLQPGQNETWSFTIKDDKNDQVAAEVLASMYDASLDEFTPHNWLFNPIASKAMYYSYNTSNANLSFNTTHFQINNSNRNYYGFPSISYHTYNWFGFTLNNNRWFNKNYLRETKQKLQSIRTDFDGTVSGIVSGEKGTGPLPGVSIVIKGTTFGTTTDFDGNYTLKVKKGDALVFSYIGFNKKEITVIDALKNVNIVLEKDDNELDEVVVIGYGTQRKKTVRGNASKISAESMLSAPNANLEDALEGSAAGVSISGAPGAGDKISIRGLGSFKDGESPLIVVDGVIVASSYLKNIDMNDVAAMEVLKGTAATAMYGSSATNGVIVITTKSGQAKLDKELSSVKARKNLQETAFFFPQLKTNKKGAISFNFTAPEALTRWKLQLLAHTTELKSATKTLQTVTQKELMVVPNAPRFLRQGDTIVLSAKITNLSKNALDGFAQLQLTDAITQKQINIPLENIHKNQNFTVAAGGNTNVSWNLTIPYTIQSVQYKIVAKAGDFSDGEQNVLPVLTNRMLVTETIPMWVRSNQTKTFSLDKLASTSRSQQNRTLTHHKLTLEVTSNPVWYAVQALPYLMEYPYECAEQTFARYYANTIASFVANSNPKIQEVFNAWKSSDALLSNLEKNQELKSLLIQETPWLRDAQSEAQQKKRIALLFDLHKMKNEQEKAVRKLTDIQKNSGGFPWFKGGRYESNFITQHIATGFGHLQKIGITDFDAATKKMIQKSVSYLDKELLKQYTRLLERATEIKRRAKNKKEGEKAYASYLSKNNLGYFTIQYLYMRSFYKDIKINKNIQKVVTYYQNQTIQYWNDYNLYAKGQIALNLFRNDKKTIANKILKSLKENSITSDELGMYWKENTAGYYYYQAPVETQALLIETFAEIENDTKSIDNLKIWLLKNKQTNRWKTTKATTEAIYALLLNGSDWISVEETVALKVGDKNINPSAMENVKIEAGTGYFKTSWNREEITPNMGKVTITKKEKGIAWGGLYWQYFEDLDKITSAETPLKLKKNLFLKVNSATGKELQEISQKTNLKVGDLITVRIELKVDRDMEFIHMKDMRASGVEPINVLSKYKWQDGLGYYESTKDAATNFFFDRLPKGIYIFEYDVSVNNAGNFSNGITTIQSMYAPEFSSHSSGKRIKIH